MWLEQRKLTDRERFEVDESSPVSSHFGGSAPD
jgi:hypothetical protein